MPNKINKKHKNAKKSLNINNYTEKTGPKNKLVLDNRYNVA